METFNNIKRLCTLVSRETARGYLKDFLGKAVQDPDPEVVSIMNRQAELQEMLSTRNLSAAFGPVKSGGMTPEGAWKEFVALVQTFNKGAPELKGVANEISRSFRI